MTVAPPEIVLSQVAEQLGEGASGRIFALTGDPTRVAKIYKDSADWPAAMARVRAMLSAPPLLAPVRVGAASVPQIAWPNGIVVDQHGRGCGFTMPRVDTAHSHGLERLMTTKARRRYGLPLFYGHRVVAARNLALIVAALHRRGHHIIDLKTQNLLLRAPEMILTVIDTDGFSIAGAAGARFPATHYTEETIAPEVGTRPPSDLGEDQDRFALAVLIFRLLNNGLHPYQGRPAAGATIPNTIQERINARLYAYGHDGHGGAQHPSPLSIHRSFPIGLRALFDRAFGSDPTDRPSAADFHRYLAGVTADDGVFRPCARYPQEHGHFGLGCGWCALEQRVQAAVSARSAQHPGRPTPPAAVATRAPRAGPRFLPRLSGQAAAQRATARIAATWAGQALRRFGAQPRVQQSVELPLGIGRDARRVPIVLPLLLFLLLWAIWAMLPDFTPTGPRVPDRLVMQAWLIQPAPGLEDGPLAEPQEPSDRIPRDRCLGILARVDRLAGEGGEATAAGEPLVRDQVSVPSATRLVGCAVLGQQLYAVSARGERARSVPSLDQAPEWGQGAAALATYTLDCRAYDGQLEPPLSHFFSVGLCNWAARQLGRSDDWDRLLDALE